MRLSPHQKRVLAALLELELAHNWRWWSRAQIGEVVGAGGYHSTLQMSTIAVLKSAGLVQTEWSSWSPEVRALVRCGCATGEWGLTNKGRTKARSMRVLWDEDGRKRIEIAKWHGCHVPGREPIDEDEVRAENRRRLEQWRREEEEREDGEEWKQV